MKKTFGISALLLLFAQSSFAIVDMKGANYSDSWTDLIVPGVGYDLRVNRTYNSRSLFNGIFGFGWCSDFETKIEVLPESTLKLTECGGGMEITYWPKSYSPAKLENTIKQIVAEVKKKRPDLRADYISGFEKELRINDVMREEFSRRMNIKGKIEDGVVYAANGREAENITLKGGVYKRSLADGTYQLFDPATGHMTSMYDKNQNFLKLTWNKDIVTQVSDNLGRKLTFKYNESTKKVTEIVGPNGLNAKYVIKGEDLIEVTDAKDQKYKYGYDDVHNLTRIDFPDKTYKALTYNKDKDWVTAFRNRKGCTENYDYQVSKDDPKNHFWSNVVKKCDGKVTNQSKYEFFHRQRPNGPGVYLYRVRTEVNANVTDIVYHEVFGKPISILRDNIKTDYTYFDNGFVKTKKEPGKMMTFEYKNNCMKVSHVTLQFSADDEKERKPSQASKAVKTVRTKFTYESQKCNLVAADNSEGQTVKLQYDPQGRISQIEDQSKKLVKIQYEAKFGKPATVTRPGLGTIQVSYKPDGEIAKVESKQGPNVAVQVASIFNNLLDIIAPATSETPL
ncbi:MAG: cell wall-associated protein wapA [Bdellovibrionales bacterium]|nr:cell wall-associated protein wapA [Bdellovibrionales bacterium]